MRIFNLINNFSVVCETKNTRSGFKHVASLFKNGLSIYETKVLYYNRTWECFQYETVLIKCIENYFETSQKQQYLDIIKKEV